MLNLVFGGACTPTVPVTNLHIELRASRQLKIVKIIKKGQNCQNMSKSSKNVKMVKIIKIKKIDQLKYLADLISLAADLILSADFIWPDNHSVQVIWLDQHKDV